MLTSMYLNEIFEIFFSKIATQGSLKYLTIKSFFKNKFLDFGGLRRLYIICDLYYFELNGMVILFCCNMRLISVMSKNCGHLLKKMMVGSRCMLFYSCSVTAVTELIPANSAKVIHLGSS